MYVCSTISGCFLAHNWCVCEAIVVDAAVAAEGIHVRFHSRNTEQHMRRNVKKLIGVLSDSPNERVT